MGEVMSEAIEAWYSAPRDLRVPRTWERIEPGAIVRVALGSGSPRWDSLKLCEYGLHASRNPLDALAFRPDGILTLVRLRGEIVEGDDKLCASERETVAVMDPATQDQVLRLLACTYAEWAIGWSGVEPDQRSIDAVECARRFAWGRATRDELAAARAAAGDAARDAARDAAGDAARDAARAAADRELRAALGVPNG
jgi:hypothetical protein